MHIIKLNGNEINLFIRMISSGKRCSPTNKHELARYEHDGNLIVVYSTGKVVFSKFPSEKLSESIVRMFESVDPFSGCTIGTDEVGKGEFMGPLVVGSVLLRSKRERAFARLQGAMDSKLLSQSQINDVFARISKFKHSVRMLSPRDFNKQFNNNLTSIMVSLHMRCIASLAPFSKGRCAVIIDKFGGSEASDTLISEIKQVFGSQEVDVVIEPRAEAHPSVSCASIIAKHEYMRWILSHSQSTGIDLGKATRSRMLEFDEGFLRNVCKLKYLKRK